MNYLEVYRPTCLRCGREVGSAVEWPLPSSLCEGCAEEGASANVSLDRRDPLRVARGPGEGIWRWGELLPIDRTWRTSLGEGDTPLIRAERLGPELGLNRLWLKDESRNPTWSYKDRLAAVAISRAREVACHAVVVASTGNHGAAAAAYAARAGLPCIVLTLSSVPDVMKTQMLAYGAMVLAVRRSEHRWDLMRELVRSYGFFPLSGYDDPPIGSNCFAVEGYRTIAYEIWEQLGRAPDWVAMPTCYGDGLLGTFKGFRDLLATGQANHLPRMLAAEVAGSITATLDRGGEDPVSVSVPASPAFSINTGRTTHQALHAVRQSQGGSMATREEDLIQWQLRLARTEGVYAEASSVNALAAVALMRRRGDIGQDDDVVVVLTSGGLKDPGASSQAQQAVPEIEPTVGAMRSALGHRFDYTLA